MFDVHFNGRLSEREVSRNIFHLCGSGNLHCKHTQEAKQRSEVHIVAKNDTLCLIEVAQVGCVNLVIAETAGNSEVFARNFCLVQLVGGQNRALAAHNETACEFSVETVVPAAASGSTAVFVYCANVGQIRLFNALCVCRSLDTVDIVDVAGRMELRHEQRITVPKLSLYERTIEFLEAERTELVLDRLKELHVRVGSAGNDSCRRN